MKFHSRLSVGFSVLLFILSILIAINVFEYRLMDKGLFGLCGPLWIFVVLCGPLWIFVVLCGPLWFFVDLCGSLWIFVVDMLPAVGSTRKSSYIPCSTSTKTTWSQNRHRGPSSCVRDPSIGHLIVVRMERLAHNKPVGMPFG